ncbi:hypothetical protein ACJW30_12G026100 [Castanea mollissima]
MSSLSFGLNLYPGGNSKLNFSITLTLTLTHTQSFTQKLFKNKAGAEKVNAVGVGCLSLLCRKSSVFVPYIDFSMHHSVKPFPPNFSTKSSSFFSFFSFF